VFLAPLDDLTDITEEFVRDPMQLAGIPLAIIGAVFLSVGAQLQHRGVTKVDATGADPTTSGLNVGQLTALLTRPSWVLGTLMLGLAIVFQLGALGFSPLIIVQPLGAIALVLTAVINSKAHDVRLNRASIRAVVACVGGVALFVTIAALVAGEKAVTDANLVVILALLATVLAVFGLAFALLRHRMRAIFYIVGAGFIYGFVATLAKVIINRVQNGNVEWLTLLCGVALLAGTALGAYFVQNAYSSGPPDLVIAGLTVIDPMVAIGIGIVVLGEAAGAPLWAVIGFIVAGLLATWGVFQLARHHPQLQN
jgi:drug/metabolite transporter (DMT)-like permease